MPATGNRDGAYINYVGDGGYLLHGDIQNIPETEDKTI